MSFQMRTSCPGSGNKNFIRTASGGWNTCIKGSPTHKYCDVLANCVGYASGRFNEIINNVRGTTGCTYKNLNCNAENFIERAKSAGLKVGSTPKVGAIICWQKGNTLSGNDGAGHVAVVEDVYDNGHIYTSESGYGSSYFWNSHRYNSNGRWGIGSGYIFRGFIYLPDDVQKAISDTPAPKPSPSSKFEIGDEVVINGPLYISSNATTANGSVSNKRTKITRKVSGALHPYNTTGDLGWMDESSIKKYEEPKPTPKPEPTPEWPKYHTVVAGDTLSKIAKKYYGSGDKNHYMFIADYNNLADPNLIVTGQKLTIPEYTGYTPKPTNELKVGDKVKITGTGNGAADGSKNTAGGIGWTREILKIHKNKPYPYQVGNSKGTTGFYKASSLKKI